MKAIWTGDIGFGLVSIPVKLYSASQRSELNLDMLDKKDKSHIKYKRVNEETGKEVEWNDIVKGYELDGRYIILDDKDFERASPEKTKRIEIMEFVDVKEIDSIYFETPYYLEPAKNGAKPYALFREALAKTNKAGIGTFVLRSKEQLGVIKVMDNALVLNKIRFAEEIRDTKELNIPKESKLPQNQIKMAVTLINEMTDSFDISQYKDTYSAELMKIIKAKAKGKKPETPKMEVVHKKSEDLMDQLKESLKARHKKIS